MNFEIPDTSKEVQARPQRKADTLIAVLGFFEFLIILGQFLQLVGKFVMKGVFALGLSEWDPNRHWR